MTTGLTVSRCSISLYRSADTMLKRPMVSVVTELKFSRRFIGSCSMPAETPFVVVDDKKYGNKEVISLTPRLYDYVLSNVREPEILRQLREETAKLPGSQMQVSPDQAQLLAMLVQILGAERCIEVGVFKGYSSLAVALVLPESGRLVACERDSNSLEVAKRYYSLAGVSNKIILKHGHAAETLNSMIQNGEGSSYDFAFVDADKRMYQHYFELLLQLVRVGGVIVMDNVLWHGRVADPTVNDVKTMSIRDFNKKLMNDKRVSISMGSSEGLRGLFTTLDPMSLRIPFLLLVFCLIGLQAVDDFPDKSQGGVCSGLSEPGGCPINCFRADPVCGVDGVTYWCGCIDAACHGVRVVKTGACDAGNAGSASVPGQALLLIHTVWLFLLGLSLLIGVF